jgi:hypothetical protein
MTNDPAQKNIDWSESDTDEEETLPEQTQEERIAEINRQEDEKAVRAEKAAIAKREQQDSLRRAEQTQRAAAAAVRNAKNNPSLAKEKLAAAKSQMEGANATASPTTSGQIKAEESRKTEFLFMKPLSPSATTLVITKKHHLRQKFNKSVSCEVNKQKNKAKKTSLEIGTVTSDAERANAEKKDVESMNDFPQHLALSIVIEKKRLAKSPSLSEQPSVESAANENLKKIGGILKEYEKHLTTEHSKVEKNQNYNTVIERIKIKKDIIKSLTIVIDSQHRSPDDRINTVKTLLANGYEKKLAAARTCAEDGIFAKIMMWLGLTKSKKGLAVSQQINAIKLTPPENTRRNENNDTSCKKK